MKFIGACLAFLLAAVLSAGTEPGIRIADCIGDDAVRTAAIQLALRGSKTGFSQIRVRPETALKKLARGEYDLVLIRVSELPEKFPGTRQDYALEAAMAVVNERNSRSSFTVQELAEIWSGWRKSWKTLNGEEFQIHLLRQPENSFALRLFRCRVMGERSFAPAFERNDSAELLRMLRLNDHAMALCERPDADFPTDIKPVSVNGIYPSLDNLRNGRYPLCDRRAVLCGPQPGAAVQQFLKYLRSPEMGKILSSHGLLQP